MYTLPDHPDIRRAERMGRPEAIPAARCDECGDLIYGDRGHVLDAGGLPLCIRCAVKLTSRELARGYASPEFSEIMSLAGYTPVRPVDQY